MKGLNALSLKINCDCIFISGLLFHSTMVLIKSSWAKTATGTETDLETESSVLWVSMDTVRSLYSHALCVDYSFRIFFFILFHYFKYMIEKTIQTFILHINVWVYIRFVAVHVIAQFHQFQVIGDQGICWVISLFYAWHVNAKIPLMQSYFFFIYSNHPSILIYLKASPSVPGYNEINRFHYDHIIFSTLSVCR